jgi:hydrogenase-4 component F
MNSLAVICLLPLVAALIGFVSNKASLTRKAVTLLLWLHLGALVWVLQPVLVDQNAVIRIGADLLIDNLAALFMLLTTVVVATSMTHADGFFTREAALTPNYAPSSERLFYGSACLFLLAMTFVFMCDNIGFLWISIEGTTLSSTALVYFSRTKHAIEATWKYVIICSVGIAFALFGTILIFASSQHGASHEGTLSLTTLLQSKDQLQFPLLRLGYLFCLLGYGTKAGIFPLHSWLPDAHSEAPAPASAMLSGALLNCALFAIWKLSILVNATEHSNVATMLPLTLGTVTALAAALFLVHQTGLKRLWAYSSIENVGLMLVAIGLGSGPLFFLQALNHSVAKVGLFLLSGNFIQACGTKKLGELHGLAELSPFAAMLMVACALAVTGAPPFGAFVAEWMIMTRIADGGMWILLVALIAALTLAFCAVNFHVARVLFGTPRKPAVADRPYTSCLVPAVLALCTLAAGITLLPSLLVKLQ